MLFAECNILEIKEGAVYEGAVFDYELKIMCNDTILDVLDTGLLSIEIQKHHITKNAELLLAAVCPRDCIVTDRSQSPTLEKDEMKPLIKGTILGKRVLSDLLEECSIYDRSDWTADKNKEVVLLRTDIGNIVFYPEEIPPKLRKKIKYFDPKGSSIQTPELDVILTRVHRLRLYGVK